MRSGQRARLRALRVVLVAPVRVSVSHCRGLVLPKCQVDRNVVRNDAKGLDFLMAAFEGKKAGARRAGSGGLAATERAVDPLSSSSVVSAVPRYQVLALPAGHRRLSVIRAASFL